MMFARCNTQRLMAISMKNSPSPTGEPQLYHEPHDLQYFRPISRSFTQSNSSWFVFFSFSSSIFLLIGFSYSTFGYIPQRLCGWAWSCRSGLVIQDLGNATCTFSSITEKHRRLLNQDFKSIIKI